MPSHWEGREVVRAEFILEKSLSLPWHNLYMPYFLVSITLLSKTLMA